ncbi:hypothetical protein BT93_B0829 [Corymbia citriodora subsp. variegata]|nr:hypothetical protein BT93_B0829 [Corymbia citriodora subsp. variegata]
MAEAIIINIAGEIIAKLIPQALEKVGKLWVVKHELELLRDVVSTLRAVLDDAEEQYYQSRQVRVWLEKLKDAFYDAQDVLEEINIEAMRRELRGHNEMVKEVRTFFSSSNQLAFKVKMSYKVREVREKIEAINASKSFHLDECPMDLRVEREWRKREETHSFIREGDIIGRDDDKKTVMKFLLDSNMKEHISILAIIGIVKNIITCAKKKEPKAFSMEQLQSELRAEIDQRKYLLVLDDLWNAEQETWLSLKTLLEGGARGSKILITTCITLVAEFTSTTPPHFLGGLSESASLDLLMEMACRKEEEIQDPDMLATGKEIIRKCSRVPLVVQIVGSLLFFKKTKFEWIHFKDYELQEVSQREDHIIHVLRLSYDHLPSHLKQCFALCSLFPKDYVMDKLTLVNLWMAEGYIQPSSRSQHLEDIANGYFMDLLWSNFFQDFQKDTGTCKMHDLMHDLACLLQGLSIGWHGMIANPYMKEHRLHILDLHDTSVKKVPRSICKLKHFTYLNLSHNNALKRVPNSITRLQNLQTLNLNCCYALEELPRESLELQWGYLGTDDLVNGDRDEALLNGLRRNSNLQYLVIKGYKGESFPRWMMDSIVFSLPNLVEVRLDKCGRCKHLPPLGQLPNLKYLQIWGLTKLEYIESDHSSILSASFPSLLRLQLGECENLKVMPPTPHLEHLMLSKVNLELINHIFGLKRLKCLKISNMEFLKFLPNECLRSLTLLEILGVGDCPRLTSLSLSMQHLPNLVRLSFWCCEELDLSKDESNNILDLQGFESLRSVDIFDVPKLACLPQWLLQVSNLERLWINRCLNLKALPEQINALQSLQRLDIIRCSLLTSLPEGIITGCRELEERCKKDIGEDWCGHNNMILRNARGIRVINRCYQPDPHEPGSWQLFATQN